MSMLPPDCAGARGAARAPAHLDKRQVALGRDVHVAPVLFKVLPGPGRGTCSGIVRRLQAAMSALAIPALCQVRTTAPRTACQAPGGRRAARSLAGRGDKGVHVAHHQLERGLGLGAARHLELVNELARHCGARETPVPLWQSTARSPSQQTHYSTERKSHPYCRWL